MTDDRNLWGGRFTEAANEVFAEFNNSFKFDRRLFSADVRASIAHANALFGAGVLSDAERGSITGALSDLLGREGDAAFFDRPAEDVHSFIESRLIEMIGDTGRKLHTGRSRNDQVATAFRLWLREEIDRTDSKISLLQAAILDAAERHSNAVLPGYTHLQRAQPVLWAHWCLAYFEMFARDRERLADCRRRVNVLPLGSGALAGGGFAVDREAAAEELGFEAVSGNSLDAVSDRDFAVEFLSAASLVMVHLSRLAEDLILYCTAEFGFIELSDAVSTGSSLMPQKKNPDALELIRGKAGRVFGRNAGLLATMKSLPLAYNKDMQEDKEALFDAVDTVNGCLQVAAIVMQSLTLNEERAKAAASAGFLNATELADYLVRKGVPFRAAHDTVGSAVLYGVSVKKELHDMSLEELKNFNSSIDDDVFGHLSLDSTLAAKAVTGGTAPQRVAEALREAKNRL